MTAWALAAPIPTRHADHRLRRGRGARRFQAVRQALDIGRFIAFGHSVGGGMGICCAATHPQDCDALITESAQTFAEDRTLDGIRAAQRTSPSRASWTA